jgi:uncharacterized membrane protein
MGSSGEEKVIDRIASFSDAIMGFAVTLLITNITIPANLHTTAELVKTLLVLWPHYLAYVISFYVVGYNWMIHLRIFKSIVRYDAGLLWGNIVFLFFIAILPLPTELLSLYPHRKIAVFVYAVTLMCVNLARTVMWWHSVKDDRLIESGLTADEIRWTLRRNLYITAAVALSLVLALISPLGTLALWVLLMILAVLTRLQHGRR